jgi:hypothetical protein
MNHSFGSKHEAKQIMAISNQRGIFARALIELMEG